MLAPPPARLRARFFINRTGRNAMHRRELFAKVGVLGAAALAGNAASAASHADAKPSASPLAGHHVHFCGIHTAKNNPKFILTIQHY